MSNIIDFEKYYIKSRLIRERQLAYSRWQSSYYQRMQEAAEKRKALQDNQLDS